MPSSSYYKFNHFVEDLCKGCHNLLSNTIKVALTNTLPVNTNEILSEITQCSGCPGNLDSVTLTITSCDQTSGTVKWIVADKDMTATGAVGPFQYVILYNDTCASPTDPLICWFNYGTSISLGTGEKLTLDLDQSNGVFQLV